MELAKTHASDPAALKVIFSSIVLECKIFYSLNFQVSTDHHIIIIRFFINLQVQGHHPHQWAPFQVTG